MRLLTVGAVGVVLFAAHACGGDRGNPPPETASGQLLELRIDTVLPDGFREITTFGSRLWIGAGWDVVAIDPVAERWTRLYRDTFPVVAERFIPCGSRLWLLNGDRVLVVDPATLANQSRGVRSRVPLGPARLVLSRCGTGGLLSWDGASLHFASESNDSTVRYEVPPIMIGNNRGLVTDFLGIGDRIYLRAEAEVEGVFPGLYRFDPSTRQLERIAVPDGWWVQWLERSDEGLVVYLADGNRHTLHADGQWRPRADRARGNVVAEGDQIVWVGASYDVAPASYFVLRYIRDAMAPKDLLILPGYAGALTPRAAVHHLGMLWFVSGKSLLRVDPTADELVRYRLKRTGGEMDRRAFSLKQLGIPLPYFDGDTVTELKFPVAEPAEPEAESDTAPPDSTPSPDIR